MRISISIPEENTITNHGYGVAAFGMVRALQDLGHEVPFKDPTAPVEIAFCQPYLWEWSNPDAYHIGYVPWESTRLPAGWADKMKTADEIWTTSPWCKWVFEKAGLENVHVYLHGVDTLSDGAWERKRRKLDDGRPVRFLHMGEPAPRKGGQLTYDAFMETFGDDPDGPTLTIKAHSYNTIRGKSTKNVRLITAELEPFELVDLIRRHDVLVYPSYGEGFGLIPLQALVTGMPVICPGVWAPYKEFLIPELILPTRLVKSPWPDVHPGNMYQPSEEALRATMWSVADPDTFMRLSLEAYARSFDVEKKYDWLSLTRDAFAHVVEKFGD